MRAPFDDVRAFARRVADLLAQRHPRRYTTETSKKARGLAEARERLQGLEA